jgi:ribonuclease D
MTNSIEWPTTIRSQTSNPVLLPELELNDADYEAAAEALRNLDDCFSEVVFLHEVATRNCRERQLEAELARKTSPGSLQTSQTKNLLRQWQKPTPIDQFISFAERNPTFIHAKK